MTKEEFEKSWIRESGTQPGIMLEVTSLNEGTFIQAKQAA